MFETVVSTVPLNPVTVVLSYTYHGYNYAGTVWFFNCYIEYSTYDTRYPAPAGLNVDATVYTYYRCGVYTIYPVTTTITATVTTTSTFTTTFTATSTFTITRTVTATITATIYPTTVTVRVPVTHLNRNYQVTVQLDCVYTTEVVVIDDPVQSITFTYTTTYYSCPRITVTPGISTTVTVSVTVTSTVTGIPIYVIGLVVLTIRGLPITSVYVKTGVYTTYTGYVYVYDPSFGYYDLTYTTVTGYMFTPVVYSPPYVLMPMHMRGWWYVGTTVIGTRTLTCPGGYLRAPERVIVYIAFKMPYSVHLDDLPAAIYHPNLVVWRTLWRFSYKYVPFENYYIVTLWFIGTPYFDAGEYCFVYCPLGTKEECGQQHGSDPFRYDNIIVCLTIDGEWPYD